MDGETVDVGGNGECGDVVQESFEVVEASSTGDNEVVIEVNHVYFPEAAGSELYAG